MRPSKSRSFVNTSGSTSPSRCSERVGALERDIDERKGVDFLRLAVFEEREVFALEIADEVAARIGDDGIDLDQVGLDTECQLRCRSVAGWAPAGVCGAVGTSEAPSAKTAVSEGECGSCCLPFYKVLHCTSRVSLSTVLYGSPAISRETRR